MRPLHFLANAFINVFGITRPAPERTERAARFIGALLVALLIVVAAAAALLRGIVSR